MGNDVLIALMSERRVAARRAQERIGLLLHMTCCVSPFH